MKTVILAGGRGRRLHPLTMTKPKPMLHIGEKPILEYIIQSLKSHNLKDLIFAVGYLKEEIKDYFGDGSNFGVNITYIEEDIPMGTAGCLKLGENLLKETFLVVSGDLLTDIDYTDLIRFHKEKRFMATVALFKTGTAIEYGVVEYDKDFKIYSLKEKPVIVNWINAGIYVLEPEVLSYIPAEVEFDFAKDLFPKLIQERGIYGYTKPFQWCDLGRLDDYEVARNIASILGFYSG